MTAAERKTTWESALNTVFPDKWEFKPVDRDGYIYLIIYFPEVIIKNDLELEHTIKDLFVKLRFYPNYTLNAHPIGFRTTYTIKEYALCYTHSHISALAVNNRNVNANTFCLGSSELSPQLRALNYLVNDDATIVEEELLMLLFNLETYVAWESLEGGPYKKIETLNDWSLINQSFAKNIGEIYRDTATDLNRAYKKVLPFLKDITPSIVGSPTNVEFNFNKNQLYDIFNSINTLPCLKNTDYLVPTDLTTLKEYVNRQVQSVYGVTPFVFKATSFPFLISDLDTFEFTEMDMGMPTTLQNLLLTKINYEYNNSAKKYFTSQKN